MEFVLFSYVIFEDQGINESATAMMVRSTPIMFPNECFVSASIADQSYWPNVFFSTHYKTVCRL